MVWSCRSPKFLNIIKHLEKYKDYFIRYWWHEQAAWFAIDKDKYMDFKKAIIKDINLINFGEQKKEIKIDKLVEINEIWFKFLENINKYKPFWIWNPRPIFMIKDFQYNELKYLWKEKKHLTFTNKQWFKILAFNFWDHYKEISKKQNISIIFDIFEDNWNGRKNLMLKIIDLIGN